MTRQQVGRILMQMEQIRMDSYEAENDREERRLDREYGRLSRIVTPYITGKVPYTDDLRQPALPL